MTRLTWDAAAEESVVTSHFRRDVIAMLSRGGQSSVLAEAQVRFMAYFGAGGGSSLSADLRGLVFNMQAKQGDKSHFALLRTRYEQSDFIEEKLDCLSAIGRFKSATLKREAIQWALLSVRSQDIQYVFSSVACDVEGAQLAWQYVQEHWEALNQQFAHNIVGRIVHSVIARFQSTEKATEVEAFMDSRKSLMYPPPHERLLVNAQWLGRTHQCVHASHTAECAPSQTQGPIQ